MHSFSTLCGDLLPMKFVLTVFNPRKRLAPHDTLASRTFHKIRCDDTYKTGSLVELRLQTLQTITFSTESITVTCGTVSYSNWNIHGRPLCSPSMHHRMELWSKFGPCWNA